MEKTEDQKYVVTVDGARVASGLTEEQAEAAKKKLQQIKESEGSDAEVAVKQNLFG